MKNIYKKAVMLIVFGLLWLTQDVAAQSSSYTISNTKSNDMKLSGTSSLHDWHMNAQAFTAKAEFDFKIGDDKTLIGLNSLTFSLPVTNLKSDKTGLDKNAYKALNTDKYKNIMYTLVIAKVSPEKEHKFLIKTTGNLTISGVTKEVAIDVYCVVNNNTSIHCTGTELLKMSDYKVKPPSFLLGAMKTGDDLKLDFNMVFVNSKIN